jgi:hypothetical protein
MKFISQFFTWIIRLLATYQILLSYWAFEDILDLDRYEFTKVTSDEHGIYLFTWNIFSLIFGLLTFVGIRAFCEPELYVENCIYYEISDLASRFAHIMCWLYYFIVCFTWILYADLNASRFSILLGFLLLVILSGVGEINISVLTTLFAALHLCISILTLNYWGIAVAVSMVFNGFYVVSSDDPSPLRYWSTLLFIIGTWMSSIFMAKFIRNLRNGSILQDYSLVEALKRLTEDLSTLQLVHVSSRSEASKS